MAPAPGDLTEIRLGAGEPCQAPSALPLDERAKCLTHEGLQELLAGCNAASSL